MQLFRQQALDHQHRLHGEVFLVPPLRWQAIGWLLLSFVAAAILFLALGSYSRTVTASGALRPAGGVASIAVPEDGVLSAVLVRDGETVREGQVIARLTLPQLAGGQSLALQRQDELAQEQSALARQRSSAQSAVEGNGRKLAATILDEQRQIAAIDTQIGQQQALIVSSEQELARIESVAQSGFISGRDLQQRRELLITRRQALAALQQDRSRHANALTAAQIELGELSSHLRAGRSGYDAQLAALRREGATLGNAGNMTRIRLAFENVSFESDHAPYNPGDKLWTIEPRNDETKARIDALLKDWQHVPSRFQTQMARFHDALEGTAPMPVTSADSRRALEIVTAFYHSSTTHEDVALPIPADHPRYQSWVPPQFRAA